MAKHATMLFFKTKSKEHLYVWDVWLESGQEDYAKEFCLAALMAIEAEISA